MGEGIFAGLVQARALRGFSQRTLAYVVGLCKPKESARINRCKHGVNSLSIDSLVQPAKAKDVPAAFLLAESKEYAETILAAAG